MGRLNDVLAPRPRILFVGINPSLTSAAVGHHFATPSNPFWRLLFAANLVPEELTCDRDKELTRHGLAITNLVARATRAAAELRAEEFARGVRTLRRKLRTIRPGVVALVGVTLYPRIVPRVSLPGPGAKPELVEGARLFVLPNPSGLNASYPDFASKLRWFRELRAFAASLDRKL